MRLLISFNKTGYEGACWMREIAQASTERVRFIPFNPGALCPPALYDSAAALDRAYQRRDPRVLALQAGLEAAILEHSPDVLFVTNSPPYHPDYLRTLRLYKVLNTTDDPGSTYVRTIPYLHAYDHVVYADPAYSQDFDMPDLLRYCGVRDADWLPIGVFDYEHRPDRDEATLFRQERDIEVVYVGSFFMQKLPLFST
ncbi:MAG TPA: hypothetical protein VFQ38_09070, partial [Longimicrobiales bacterium]|nr:hypothetical protein [Longimicrobiales bacterium]